MVSGRSSPAATDSSTDRVPVTRPGLDGRGRGAWHPSKARTDVAEHRQVPGTQAGLERTSVMPRADVAGCQAPASSRKAALRHGPAHLDAPYAEMPIEVSGPTGVMSSTDPAGCLAPGHVSSRPDSDPDFAEGLRRADVLDCVGRYPAYVRERHLDDPEHLGERDLASRPRQPVAALRPALALHEPRVAKLEQDVLEEPEQDRLRLGDPLSLHRPRPLRGRELDGGPDGVVGLGRDAHSPAYAPARCCIASR